MRRSVSNRRFSGKGLAQMIRTKMYFSDKCLLVGAARFITFLVMVS